MKTLNQDDFFRIQTLIIENMAMNHEDGKQSRHFRKLAKLLAKINEVSGYERKFKLTKDL